MFVEKFGAALALAGGGFDASSGERGFRFTPMEAPRNVAHAHAEQSNFGSVMKVQGVEIPQVVQDDAVAFIKRQPSFRSFDLQRAIEAHPMIEELSWKPSGLAMRVADRIIQQQRKAGKIGPGAEEKPRTASWRWLDQ